MVRKIGKLTSIVKYGDFIPSGRMLITVGRIYKVVQIQSDVLMQMDGSSQVGMRTKVETPKFAGYSVEVAAGLRATLKTPGLWRDLINKF